MAEDLLKKYDRQVPRYTSYPTAPHFHEGVAGETYGEWLGALGNDDTLSLYFHVPFCAEMCWFCGCHTKVTRKYEPVVGYVSSMHRELDLVSAALKAQPKVTSVHWGGGSPTMLKPDDFTQLMQALREKFNLAEDAEIAVEIDPRTLAADFIEALVASGVNRVSLGVQDFDDTVQQAINRVQPYEMVAKVVEDLRAAGIKAFNFDLIYGLPYQTAESIIRTVDLAMKLQPDRLSVFGYAHVPWMKTHQRMIKDETLPDTAQRFELAELLANQLISHDYDRIGLDHFAKADDAMQVAHAGGTLRRNFQGYTTDSASALIGIGASSIGYLPQGYVQNQVPLKTYMDAMNAGDLATARGIALSDQDKIRGRIIEELMCQLKVDLADFGEADLYATELGALQPLAEDGLVKVQGSKVQVTEKGRPFMRLACAVFDAYLKPEPKRYSKAI